MIGLGTIVNVAAVLAGGTLGLLLKKLLTDRLTNAIMQGLGLAVITVGLGGTLSAYLTISNGSLTTENTLLMIISLAVGALIGELIGIEDKLDSLAAFCEKKIAPKSKASTFAQGFVTATLVFCAGAMTIVGSIEDGINGNTDILFAKSTLDAIGAMVFASAMGAGVLLSAAAVAVYQGLITVLAVFISPYLNDAVIIQMSLIGSVLIIGIGINMLKIGKIKVGNLLPSIFIPVLYYIIRAVFIR